MRRDQATGASVYNPGYTNTTTQASPIFSEKTHVQWASLHLIRSLQSAWCQPNLN